MLDEMSQVSNNKVIYCSLAFDVVFSSTVSSLSCSSSGNDTSHRWNYKTLD